MPGTCIIVGCTNRAGRGKPKLFRFPRLRKHSGKVVEELTERRLSLWVKAVNRKDITMKTLKSHSLICSEHFVTGRPAYYHHETHPDWVPSRNLGYGTNDNKAVEINKQVEERTHEIAHVLVGLTSASTSIPTEIKEGTTSKPNACDRAAETDLTRILSQIKQEITNEQEEVNAYNRATETDLTGILSRIKQEMTDEQEEVNAYNRAAETDLTRILSQIKQETTSEQEEISTCDKATETDLAGLNINIDKATETDLTGLNLNIDKATETDMTGLDIKNYIICVNKLTEEIVDLKRQVQLQSFDEKMFENNDNNVQFYTGLPTWQHLTNLTSFLKLAVANIPGRNVLSPFQEIMLVLVKLRLGLSNKIIGDLFHISDNSVSSVSRIFLRVLNVMYHTMKFLVCWPDSNSLKQSTPLEFVKYFGRHVSVIIGLCEVSIEHPSNKKAKAETYSSSKCHSTVKYLIGITPQGSVSYISESWGGSTSDKHIVEHSDFLSHLELGDIVLADSEFDIHDVIMRAGVRTLAFRKGENQLSVFEVDSTKKLAHRGMRVERVINNMKGKYSIFKSEMPIDYIQSADQGITTLDQIVTVCACLINICPSVGPRS